MNEQALEQARNAYRTGDFAAAAQLFAAAKQGGVVSGEIDHLRGNSLMRLGRYADAASAYAEALEDGTYGKRGALLTNQGKAYVACGDVRSAVNAFSAATQDASYATPYKAYLGLGDALKQLGNLTEAGVAYRQAAIDGTNPAPAGALANLGECFLRLNRPEDAIESYRTALDFAGPRDDARSINACLGQAYGAVNRYSDAVEAFNSATSDGIYQLSPEQTEAFDRARDVLSANAAMMPAQSHYDTGIDPLDPLGQSGNFMPDPSDTGFFTLSESEMVQADRAEMKVRRKRRHTGLKVFIFLLVVLLIAGAGGAFAYTRGFGFPSQQDVLTGLFGAVTDGSDAGEFLASGLDESQKSIILASIPLDATATIEGMDAGMSETTAKVKVSLKQGGEMTYDVDFVREGLGWTVSSISTDFTVEEASQ